MYGFSNKIFPCLVVKLPENADSLKSGTIRLLFNATILTHKNSGIGCPNVILLGGISGSSKSAVGSGPGFVDLVYDLGQGAGPVGLRFHFSFPFTARVRSPL